MKKKVLILGPIGNFGGREVEVNIIINSLQDNYDVSLLSTGYLTQKSSAINGVNLTWSSLDEKVYADVFLLRALSHLSKKLNKGVKREYGYVNNSFSKKIGLNSIYLKILKKEISQTNIVIFCGNLTSLFLQETLKFSNELKIQVYIRITGTVPKIDINVLKQFKLAKTIIYHSKSNANLLNRQLKIPYKIIDQCSLYENELLTLEIESNEPIKYGFLGRLSKEKGIFPLTKYFIKQEKEFLIAGLGAQKEEIENLIKDNLYCKYVGGIPSDKIHTFFKQIDVLIIPSYEEAGPLVAIEALAAGKIIISTKVGAMEERLQGTKIQFWFDILNIETLLKQIELLESMSALELKRCMQENRLLYNNKYSFKKIQKKYLEIINI